MIFLVYMKGGIYKRGAFERGCTLFKFHKVMMSLENTILPSVKCAKYFSMFGLVKNLKEM